MNGLLVRRPGRLGLSSVVTNHFSTMWVLDNDGQRHVARVDILLFGVLPVAAGLATAIARARFRDPGALLSATAITTGLLLGLVIHLFTLGLKIAEDARYNPTSPISTLIRETFDNAVYATVVSLTATAFIVTTLLVGVPSKGVNPVLGGVLVAVTVHLGLTILMVLRRVSVAYTRMAP